MNKIVVICSNYPSPDNIYGDVFVHTRMKAYSKFFDVQVVGYNPLLLSEKVYEYETIPVCIVNNLNNFFAKVRELKPDIVAGHLVQREYLAFLLSLRTPLIVFLHGYEILSWKRRLMNYRGLGALPYLWHYVKENKKQLDQFRQFIEEANQRSDIHFVFVSEWLREAAQEDLAKRIKNAHVIPNGIDTSLFSYQEKHESLRKKILILRSFKLRNYANDISVKAIRLLSKKSFFSDLEFCLYGEGYLFHSLTAEIRNFSNVTLNNFFVENRHIPEIYREFGVMLCPSRLDTQGVSMCEAMASGLVPVSSPVGGIPEYTTHNFSGFLVRTPEEVAEKIEYLYFHPEVFKQMSRQAHEEIEMKCELSQTVAREIDLMKSNDIR